MKSSWRSTQRINSNLENNDTMDHTVITHVHPAIRGKIKWCLLKFCCMKLSLSILFIAICCLVPIQAQKIKYESSFEKAKSLAIQQKKPLAILITIEPPVYSPNFLNGLNDEKVIKKFNSSFINYKADRSDTAASGKIIKEYRIFRFPSFIFLDAKGGFMFDDIAFLSKPQPLLDIAEKAISSTKEKSLVDYDSSYTAGNNGTVFLKDYILRREKAGISANAELIEKYVLGLKVSDLYNYDEVLFILKAGPIADGNAYKLASLNKPLIDSIFKTEPLADRLAMNNATITNTMNSAISNKNISRAMVAANFTRNTWTNNPIEGQKNWNLKIMQYYIGVKDTTKYLQRASVYYEQYYMRLTVDSVRKRDSLNYITAKKNAIEISRTIINDTTIRRSLGFSYSKDSYATELNNAAWTFYQMAVNKNDYLLKALLWSRRALELSGKPAFYDTYAHLLYRLKFFDEAESMQRKAIELGKADKIDIKLFQKEYEKIKKKAL
jgi:hypothetical protein